MHFYAICNCRSDFGKMVVKEYLRFFEFEKLSLVESLRQFLSYFSLTGESQERERIMVHFSNRYFECNPQVFTSVGELETEGERGGARESGEEGERGRGREGEGGRVGEREREGEREGEREREGGRERDDLCCLHYGY